MIINCVHVKKFTKVRYAKARIGNWTISVTIYYVLNSQKNILWSAYFLSSETEVRFVGLINERGAILC